VLFNSFEYLIFLPGVFLAYWFVFQKNLKSQNAFILVVSYVFYGWWDWRFLGLIAASSIVDYYCGLQIGKVKEDSPESTNNQSSFSGWFNGKKKFLIFSIVFNLSLLGFFKYYNFFIESAVELIQGFGLNSNTSTLNIILPVGISFYTFQTMSYTIDVYRGKIEPTANAIAFFSYVAFFPQLVAGPIERASNLLPQFLKATKISFDTFRTSLRLILWGFFKKMVVADNAAPVIDQVFDNYHSLDSLMLIIGIVFFALQLYGDFSGYTDIARGTAGLLGFSLKQNFKTPYFSRDISEYWRHWHISLYTWFRDYLYIPLGGSEGSKWQWLRNIIIVFILGSLWHGAKWTFIIWGLINIVYFLPILLFGGIRYSTKIAGGNNLLPSFKEIAMIMLTFFLTCISRVYFRSESVLDGSLYIVSFFNNWGFDWNMLSRRIILVLFLMTIFFIIEWIGRHQENPLEYFLRKLSIAGRWTVYYVIIGMILFFGGQPQEFFYFQF